MRLFAGTWLALVCATSLVAQQNVAPSATASPAPATAAQSSNPAQTPIAPAPQAAPAQQPSTANQPAAEPGAAPPPLGLGSPVLPNVTKKQAAEAKRQFEAGVKLKEKGHLDEAFTKFSSASELDPTKLDYITAREFTREQLAYQALQRGNKAMLDHNEIVAMAEFRRRSGVRSHQQLRAAASARRHSRRPGDGPSGQRGRTVAADRAAAFAWASRLPFSRRLAGIANRGDASLRHQGAVRRFGEAAERCFTTSRTSASPPLWRPPSPSPRPSGYR